MTWWWRYKPKHRREVKVACGEARKQLDQLKAQRRDVEEMTSLMERRRRENGFRLAVEEALRGEPYR